MVDANVLVAGIGWPRFPREVLQHAVSGDYQLVLSPFVIAEARKHLTRLFPQAVEQFEVVLETSNYEEISNPSKEEINRHPHLVRDLNDIPVALAIIALQSR